MFYLGKKENITENRTLSHGVEEEFQAARATSIPEIMHSTDIIFSASITGDAAKGARRRDSVSVGYERFTLGVVPGG